MTAGDAYKIITSYYPFINITNCREYDTVFVFCYDNDARKHGNLYVKPIDAALCIDKKTKKFGYFLPFLMPLDEFRNGKDVIDFKR